MNASTVRRRRRCFLLASIAACTVAGQPAQSQSWKPEKTIELVVGTAPGSGTDASARLIQKLWQESKLVNVPSAVVNKPGGGSAIAFAYVHQHAGDPHYITIGSYNLVTNYLTGKTKISYRDLTAIAHLFNEYVSFNVRADSPIRSATDLVQSLKKDPERVSIGISSSVGGANHIALALAMKAAGVDVKRLKTVVFDSGGKAMTALMGGHISVQAVAASVALPRLREGKIRMIAVSAPARLSGDFAGVPTLKELGINVVAANWRNAIAPPGLKPAQIAYWDGVFAKLVKMEEWRKDLERNHWDAAYMNSAETQNFLKAESAEIKAVLTDLGLAN